MIFDEDYNGPRYVYGMTHRPAGIGCQPAGRIVGADRPSPDPRVPFGTITYTRPLTDAEIEGYELLPVTPLLCTHSSKQPGIADADIECDCEPIFEVSP